MLSSYQKPYTKALGKDGILVHHEQNVMHQRTTERADCFKLTFIVPDLRVDSKLPKVRQEQQEENKEILC